MSENIDKSDEVKRKALEQLSAMAREFADDPDIRALVAEIEAKPETTQHHYGDYGAALNQLSGGDAKTATVMALALVLAGANRDGVMNGLKHFVTG